VINVIILQNKKTCEICRNPSRSDELICVVQDVRDLLAIESTQQFYGKYHVLGGVISPMDGIGPNDIKVNELKERIVNEKTTEIILALPATMEGDTTNFYIYRKLQEVKVNITLISRGIGVGNQLEYIDELTLGKSLLDRSIYKTNISN
jgi:recombination protein RecR